MSHCCPGSPLPNPECFLPVRMARRQTVPKADGKEQPSRHMQPTEASRNTAHAGGKWPTAWQGCACHTPSGRAGRPEDSLPRVSPASPGAGVTQLRGCGWGPLSSSLPRCSLSAESSSRHRSVRRPGAQPPSRGPNWQTGEGLALTSLKGSGTGPELGRASAGVGPLHTGVAEPVFHPQEGR